MFCWCERGIIFVLYGLYGNYPYFTRQSSILTVKCCILSIITWKDATYDYYTCKIRLIAWKSKRNNRMWRAFRLLFVHVPKLHRERFSRVRPPLREKLSRNETNRRMCISLKRVLIWSLFTLNFPLSKFTTKNFI